MRSSKVSEMIKDFLFVLFRPAYWEMLEKYDENLDKRVLQAVAEGNIRPYKMLSGIETYEYECIVGGKSLWVGNYPYSYGSFGKIRPSRRTIKLLKQYIDKVK